MNFSSFVQTKYKINIVITLFTEVHAISKLDFLEEKVETVTMALKCKWISTPFHEALQDNNEQTK